MCSVLNLSTMPYDIIALIVQLLDKDLCATPYDLKTMCVSFSKAISNVTIAKFMMRVNFGRINTRSHVCINRYCVRDTKNVMEYIWKDHDGYYMHTIKLDSLAFETDVMVVNGKEYPVRSHYCCECFKKFVLIGDNKNVSQHYEWVRELKLVIKQVNVTFNDKPTPSTWYNCIMRRVEPLNKWQVNMLCEPIDYSDRDRCVFV